MGYKNKIIKLVQENKGYITTKEIIAKGIHKSFLSILVKEGKLIKISRGYYGLREYIEDDYYKIISKSNNAVFSMNTALYLHNLSDRTPLKYDITVPQYYGGSLQKKENVNLYFVKKELLNLGVIEINSPFGMKVKVYDKEKTICDIIKYKKKIDIEIFSKALKNYVSSSDKNLNKLYDYAKTMNIEEKVIEYMEVLL